MIGIYLAAGKAVHNKYNIIYQDINGLRDIGGDMMNINIYDYDYVIAKPPCNYYSRANYRRNISVYSLSTKHLLPEILKKLDFYNKPYIVENVRNYNLMKENKCFDNNSFVYEIGRHTFWTNILLPNMICKDRYSIGNKNLQYYSSKDRQADKQVFNVIETFLEVIHNG